MLFNLFLNDFIRCPQQLGFIQTKAKNLEFNQVLPHGWQSPSYLIITCGLAKRTLARSRIENGVRTVTQHSVWDAASQVSSFQHTKCLSLYHFFCCCCFLLSPAVFSCLHGFMFHSLLWNNSIFSRLCL